MCANPDVPAPKRSQVEWKANHLDRPQSVTISTNLLLVSPAPSTLLGPFQPAPSTFLMPRRPGRQFPLTPTAELLQLLDSSPPQYGVLDTGQPLPADEPLLLRAPPHTRPRELTAGFSTTGSSGPDGSTFPGATLRLRVVIGSGSLFLTCAQPAVPSTYGPPAEQWFRYPSSPPPHQGQHAWPY